MSYQALYRVWRPQRFSDVVGQGLVVTTLKNAIITNQISHAYLFAGPRGTGKTSAAKIIATTKRMVSHATNARLVRPLQPASLAT